MQKRTSLFILLGLALTLNATAQTEPVQSTKSKRELKRARRNSSDEYKGRVAEQVRFVDDAPKVKGKDKRKSKEGTVVTSATVEKKRKSK